MMEPFRQGCYIYILHWHWKLDLFHVCTLTQYLHLHGSTPGLLFLPSDGTVISAVVSAVSSGFVALVAIVPPPHPLFFLPLIQSVLMGAWNWDSWLGCGGLPAMGEVLYLGAGWPQWKPLDTPGTHLTR